MAKSVNTFTVPVRGSNLYVQQKLDKEVKITAVGGTVAKDGGDSAITITAPGLGAKPNDVIVISGLPGLNGAYPVFGNSGDVYTLCKEIAIEELPTAGAEATAQLVVFFKRFCDVKSITYGAPTREEVDVTTICEDRPQTEPGNITYDTLSLGLWKVPDSDIQNYLRRQFERGEPFALRLDYAKKRGHAFFYGYLQQGVGFSGNAGDRFESEIVIKMQQIDYYQPVLEEDSPKG